MTGNKLISDNGVISVYDYQQDEFDQGDNCYITFAGIDAVSPLDNNEYSAISYVYPNENCSTASARSICSRSETAITETLVDIDDEDMDGNTTELLATVFPVVTGLCTDSFNSRA